MDGWPDRPGLLRSKIIMMSAGFRPGVGFAADAASCFVAGSQVGASVGAGVRLRRCRVRQ